MYPIIPLIGRRPLVARNHIDDFVHFLMVKNNLDKDEANALFISGWNSFGENGFTSNKLKNFSEFYSKVFAWKYNSAEDVYYDTYKFHSSIDFFRMLGYSAYTTDRDSILYERVIEFLIERYNQNGEVVIVDYGAGLAQITIALCKLLKQNNIDSKLVIIDIDRYIHKEFLNFVGDKYKLNLEFIDIDKKNQYPKLPKFDFMMVKDVFEHVHGPEKIVDNIKCSIKENGIIAATVDDVGSEMMHVSRDLKSVRDKFEKYGFKVTQNAWFNRGYIYQKSKSFKGTAWSVMTGLTGHVRKNILININSIDFPYGKKRLEWKE